MSYYVVKNWGNYLCSTFKGLCPQWYYQRQDADRFASKLDAIAMCHKAQAGVLWDREASSAPEARVVKVYERGELLAEVRRLRRGIKDLTS